MSTGISFFLCVCIKGVALQSVDCSGFVVAEVEGECVEMQFVHGVVASIPSSATTVCGKVHRMILMPMADRVRCCGWIHVKPTGVIRHQ